MTRLILSIVTIGIVAFGANQIALADTSTPRPKQQGVSSGESAPKRTAAPPKSTGAKNAIVKSKSNITNN